MSVFEIVIVSLLALTVLSVTVFFVLLFTGRLQDFFGDRPLSPEEKAELERQKEAAMRDSADAAAFYSDMRACEKDPLDHMLEEAALRAAQEPPKAEPEPPLPTAAQLAAEVMSEAGPAAPVPTVEDLAAEILSAEDLAAMAMTSDDLEDYTTNTEA